MVKALCAFLTVILEPFGDVQRPPHVKGVALAAVLAGDGHLHVIKGHCNCAIFVFVFVFTNAEHLVTVSKSIGDGQVNGNLVAVALDGNALIKRQDRWAARVCCNIFIGDICQQNDGVAVLGSGDSFGQSLKALAVDAGNGAGAGTTWPFSVTSQPSFR